MEHINVKTELRYKGNNISLLDKELNTKNYTSTKWGTYKCWKSLDKQVIKGEKSTEIKSYIKKIDETKVGKDGKPKEYYIRRIYHIFNENQTKQK